MARTRGAEVTRVGIVLAQETLRHHQVLAMRSRRCLLLTLEIDCLMIKDRCKAPGLVRSPWRQPSLFLLFLTRRLSVQETIPGQLRQVQQQD